VRGFTVQSSKGLEFGLVVFCGAAAGDVVYDDHHINPPCSS
jgi:hypothetical protein